MEGIEGLQTVGIVNALKTGNVVIDMTIAMLIPVIFGSLFGCITYLQKKVTEIDWRKLFSKKKNIYERSIEHSTMTSAYSTTDLGSGDSQNDVLIKAVQLYLDHHDLLKLRRAELELRQIDNDDSKNNYYYYNYDESNSTTLASTLSKYKIVKKPLKNILLNIGKYPSSSAASTSSNSSSNMKSKSTSDSHSINKEEKVDYDVQLVVTEEKENVDEKEGGSSSLKHCNHIKLHFSSEGKESIDAFVEKAYTWYLTQLKTLEDDSRYLYELIHSKASTSDEGDESGKKYKRYQLSDEKTFESLFFKEKETVLKVVDHFTNKTGKYSIKGYPNKLGLLLHGPPGTGKTSLIKALAQKTGRSIVSVPLARITTNAELAALFFDQKYYIEGERVPVNLSFKDVIFVMEDVDAVSKVVRRRDGKTTAESTYTEQVEMPITKSLWRMLMESHDEHCRELVELLVKKSERLKLATKNPTLLSSTAKRMAAIPGLSLVGENPDDETTTKMASEAVADAQAMVSNYRAVDEFIGSHAKTLKRMIDAGADINEDFENDLLGLSCDDSMSSGSFLSLRKPGFTRNVSYKKQYGESNNVLVESSPAGNNDPVSIAAAIEAMDYDEDCPEVQAIGGTNGKMAGAGIGPSNVTSSWKSKVDELNLTGLLNVLDGVVDTPGRMLVMTSNHPEMLDPALIRPGRIDKKLFLGHLRYEDLVCMVEHYFQTALTEHQVQRLKLAVDGEPSLKLTPAQVEQMACEFEEIEDMIDAIEKKKHSLIPPEKKIGRLTSGGGIAFE